MTEFNQKHPTLWLFFNFMPNSELIIRLAHGRGILIGQASLAVFIHTLPDMNDITFDEVNRSKSLMSESLITQPRWLGSADTPK